MENIAKSKLKNNEDIRVFNVFESLKPSIAKILSQTGYDLALIETEHILHNPENLTNFLLLCLDNALSTATTVTSVNRSTIGTYLDAGSQGICLSHAETTDQVEELVDCMKYKPDGSRALGHGPVSGYRIDDAASHCMEQNNSTMVILKFESFQGIENAENLLKNKWVDAVVFGPGDLAADMGLHGQWTSPHVIEAMESVTNIALKRGIAVESPEFATDRSEYFEQRSRGIQIFGPTRSSEYDLLRKGAEEAIENFLPPLS
jgi:2-keto-3-deoxy-L-rhamnonate aldolase RhmA